MIKEPSLMRKGIYRTQSKEDVGEQVKYVDSVKKHRVMRMGLGYLGKIPGQANT